MKLKKDKVSPAHHYFLNTPHTEADYFEFSENFLGKTYRFKSCADVFSKSSLDDGSKLLVKTIVEQVLPLNGLVLDIGCGYGTLGILLKTHYPQTKWLMVDINQTAVAVCKQNVELNQLPQSDFTIRENDLLTGMSVKVDHVVTNPPIKAGKRTLFAAMEQSFTALNPGGTLTLVIRKDHGMESLKTNLLAIFGNCTIIARNKGYYILHCIKQKN